MNLLDEVVFESYMDACAVEERFWWGFFILPENPKEAIQKMWSRTTERYSTITRRPIPTNASLTIASQLPIRHLNRCQKMAYEFLLRNQDRTDLQLVFGYYVIDSDGISRKLERHTWIELGEDLVFDGVVQEFFDREDYCKKLSIQIEAKLSKSEAVVRLIERRTFW